MNSEGPRQHPKRPDHGPLEEILKNYRDGQKHFGPVEETFRALPESKASGGFSIGEKVRFPKEHDNQDLSDWEIVRAEKRHYLLERRSENNLFDHVFCSEEELCQHNRR